MNSQCFPLFNFPEAISPNNDGVNDYWTTPGIELFNGYEINIFNSFGQSIYQIKNAPPHLDGTWNGQTLPNGDYFYSLKLHELNRTIFGTISIAN
jgi:gliding motility-associated-like protein